MNLKVHLVIIGLALVGCSKPAGPPVFTDEEVAKLERDMSRQEVKAIIGDPPYDDSELSVQWKNPDGTVLVATMGEEKLYWIHIFDDRHQILKSKGGSHWDSWRTR